jgi:HlyD family secretion protein
VKAGSIVGALVGAACLGLTGWGGVTLYRKASLEGASGVSVIAVKRGDITFNVYARGEFQGGNSTTLQAPMAGSTDMAITSLRSPGDLVNKDDVVATFDTTEQEYKLREAESDLAEAEQKVIQAQAQMEAKQEEDNYLFIKARSDLKLAQIEARKNPVISPIAAKQNDLAVAAAQATLDQLTRDLANRKATSQAGVAIQEAMVAKAKVQIETARKNIASMTLRSPRAGYVNVLPNTNTNWAFPGMVLPILQVGDTVRAGMGVVQIPDMQTWETTARIEEADRGHLALGLPVTITAVALPEHPYRGVISDLGGTTGPPWERRFECKIKVENPSPELRPGMTANLVISAETMKNALWIPAQALFESDGRTYVYTRTPQGGFVTTDVKLERRSESRVVITGISEGQAVAMSRPDKQADAPRKEKKAGSAVQALPK